MNVLISRNSIIYYLLFYLIVLIAFNIINSFGLLNEYLLVTMFFFNFIFFISLSYYRFNYGVHAIFIFFAMLFIFQGGLFISYLFSGNFDDISYVELQGSNTHLSFSSLVEATNLIYISCFVVFTTVVYSKKPVNQIIGEIKNPKQFSLYFLCLFILLLPFDIYKRVSYLSYIMSHGGYIAIYTNNGEHLESVGSIVRGISLISTLCFYFFFLSSNNKKLVLWITLLIFFPLSLIDLAIGLRGKFFVFWVVFILFYKFKFGGKFSIKNLVISSLLISFVSVMIAFYREERDVVIDNPLGLFFKSQGVSFHVTALISDLKYYFEDNALNYVFYPVLTPFFHSSKFPNGTLLANDLSIYLNSAAYDNGYATGSTYLAELYLAGGYLGIIIGSFILGKTLNYIKITKNIFLNTVIFVLALNLVYLPRASFLSPIAELTKALPLLITLYLSWLIFKKVNKTL